MDEQTVLDELLALLEHNNVKVRHEPMGGGGGGLCVIKGKPICFIDKDSPLQDSIGICAQAVYRLIDTELIYLKPQIRAILEKIKSQNGLQ